MELAPSLGLSRRIVDLVSSGATLKANGLVETSIIMQISARLIVNRAAFKMRAGEIVPLVEPSVRPWRQAMQRLDAAAADFAERFRCARQCPARGGCRCGDAVRGDYRRSCATRATPR
jgi:hypothetical protein